MTKQKLTDLNFTHLNYLIALERDLELISQYIEISEDNFNVYSIELVRILLLSCSEIDVVIKELIINGIDGRKLKFENMDEYRKRIHPSLEHFHQITVKIPRYSMEFKPWNNFHLNINPVWWNDHQKVKHERGLNYKKANLGNVLNAMCALFIVIYCYHRLCWPIMNEKYTLDNRTFGNWLEINDNLRLLKIDQVNIKL